MHSYRQACSGMQMDRQPCMFAVIKACRETDRTRDKHTGMQRNGQARTGRTDRHTHSGQGRRQIPRQAGSDDGREACVRATDRSCRQADQNLQTGIRTGLQAEEQKGLKISSQRHTEKRISKKAGSCCDRRELFSQVEGRKADMQLLAKPDKSKSKSGSWKEGRQVDGRKACRQQRQGK